MEAALITLGILVVAALLAWGVVKLLRRGKRNYDQQQDYDRAAKAASRPEDPFKEEVIETSDPRRIKLGDRVDCFGIPRAVRGTVRLNEDGYRWCEHYLETTDGERIYLSVEQDPDLVVVLWTELETNLVPGADVLRHDDVDYRRKEKGTAAYDTEGTTDMPVGPGVVEYYDYKGPDGQLLSFERFNSSTKWEASTGMRVDPRVLTIYAAMG